MNKKGDMAWPIYISPALAALAITLVIFGILFFIVGIAKNPNLKINGEDYKDSSKLLVILETKTNTQNLSIAQLISLANEDETYKQALETELTYLINKLPSLPENEEGILKEANWNLVINIEDKNFLEIGEQSSMQSIEFFDVYFEQKVSIPLENKKLADVELYYECRRCTSEEIDAIA